MLRHQKINAANQRDLKRLDRSSNGHSRAKITASKVVIPAISFLIVMVLSLGSASPAHADSAYTLDQSYCENILQTTWSNGQCIVSSSLTLSVAQINLPSGVTLLIAPGGSLYVQGTGLNVYGNLIVEGGMQLTPDSGMAVGSGGKVEVNQGIITLDGAASWYTGGNGALGEVQQGGQVEVINGGKFVVDGTTLNIDSGGQVNTLDGGYVTSIKSKFDFNSPAVTNSGEITTNSSLTFYPGSYQAPGGTIYLTGFRDATISLSGAGTVQVSGNVTIDPQSKLTVGTGTLLAINPGMVLENGGNLDNLGTINSQGSLSNNGTILNGQGGVIQTTGIFTNDATVSNQGSIDITIINSQSGLMINDGTISNSGSITGFNNSILDKCAGAISGNPPTPGSIQYSPCAPLITFPQSGIVISANSVTLGGTSNLASNGGSPPTISVSDGCYLCSAPLASAVTNSSGAWSVTVPLSQGIYNLYALATTNSNGYGASRIDSPPSNVITVTVGHALDSGVCAAILGGSWDPGTNTCTVTGQSTIQSGNSFQIGSGVTLNVTGTGSITNYGSLNNDGAIYVNGGGSIVNQNGGSIGNYNIISNRGTITNSAGSTLSDSGTISPSGSIINEGAFDITLDNSTCTSYPLEGTSDLGFIDACNVPATSAVAIEGGTVLTIPINWIVYNSGAISNLGTIDNSGAIKDESCGSSFTGNAVSGNPVDYTVLCPPVITTQSGVDLTGSLAISGRSNLTSNGGMPESIAIFANGTSVASTTTDSQGNWSVSPTPGLLPGFYEIYALSSNSQGGGSSPSNSILLTSRFLDQQSCQSPLGGSWNSNTCAINGNIELRSGNTLEIPSSTTLAISSTGSFTNNGTLNGAGTLTNYNELTNTGIYTVYGGGMFDNHGQMHNGLGFYHPGYLEINSGGGAKNFAGGSIDGTGEIVNSGSFDNSGKIDCSSSPSCIQNSAAFSNYGSMNITSANIETQGTFTNPGSISISFSQDQLPDFSVDGGSFNNTGTLDMLGLGVMSINSNAAVTNAKSGHVTNQFDLRDGGVLNNYGNFTNDAPSAMAIANGGESFSGLVRIFGSLNNYGVIDNLGNVTNSGVVNNQDVINDICGGMLTNSGIFKGNAVITLCDSIPPTTTVSLSGTQGDNGWYVSPVQVTLSAADNPGGSGVRSTSYSLDGGPQTAYAAPFSVTGNANHTLAFNSTDNAGNVELSHLIYIAIDSTPPVIAVPPDVTQEAAGPRTTASLGTATASDAVDGPVTVTNNATSSYLVGTTIIQYSATDLAGNTATAYQKVTITDTTPPALRLPTQVIVQATGPSGASVSYKANATDLVDGPVIPTCNPASGSTFAYGNTTVACTATDAHGNKASGTFDVDVQNKIPPLVSISSPHDTAIVSTATVPVSGTASDIVSVSKISWKVDSGIPYTISGITPGPSVGWSFDTNALSPGSHMIEVNATDSAGLVAVSSAYITYAAPSDSIPAPTGTGEITFDTNRGGFTSLESIQKSSLAASPPPGRYPLGFFSWDVAGFEPAKSVTITVTSPALLHHQSQYFKLIGNAWVAVPVSVSGNTMTFDISDNGPYDGNPATGVISDPGAIAEPTDGRVTGGGNIGLGTNFGFEVTSELGKGKTIKGSFEYHDRYVKLDMHSNAISFLSVDPTASQATIVGTTGYDRHDRNDKHGTDYTFISTITDPDKTGDHDTFSVTVANSTGYVVYQNVGTVKGHIEIHQFSDRDAMSDSGLIPHNNGFGNGNKPGNGRLGDTPG